MNSRLICGLGAGLLLAGSALPALSQVPLSARGLGMGGAFLGTARGNESLFQNPANLALSRTPYWSISFPQVSTSSTVLGPSFGEFLDLREAKDLPQEQRDEVLDRIPESGTEVQYHFRAPLATLQVGRFALGVNYGSLGQHTASKDIVELLVEGYQEGRTDYSVGNTSGSRLTYWDFAAGFGQRVGPISIGVTGHYIRSGSVVQSRLFEPRVEFERRDISINYVSVIGRGGSGYSVDFGAAYQPTPELTVSAAVANAVSKLTWSDEIFARDFTLRRSDIDNTSFASLKARYENTEERLDPGSASLRVLETARGLYDEAFLPAVAKAGIGWQPRLGTDVGVGYEQHLTSGRLADRWERTASVGVQQKLPLITARAGFATDLEEGTLISAGLSLGPIQVGLAKLTDGSVDGASRSGFVGSFGLSVQTRGLMP